MGGITKGLKKIVSSVTEAVGLTPDLSGQERAARAMEEAQKAARNLQQNYAVDLTAQTPAGIVTGADAEYGSSGTSKARKRAGTTIASNLGINA